MGKSWIGEAPGVYDTAAGPVRQGFTISGHFVPAGRDEEQDRWLGLAHDEVRRDVAEEFCKISSVPSKAEVKVGLRQDGPRYEGVIECDEKFFDFSLSGEGFQIFLVSPDEAMPRLHRLLDAEARLKRSRS